MVRDPHVEPQSTAVHDVTRTDGELARMRQLRWKIGQRVRNLELWGTAGEFALSDVSKAMTRSLSVTKGSPWNWLCSPSFRMS